MTDLTGVTPTWINPVNFDEYFTTNTISENFTKEYLLLDTTPNRQYELSFLGVNDTDFASILSQYRDVSGQYEAFHWKTISPQFSPILGEDLTPTTYTDIITSNDNTLGVTGAITCKGHKGEGFGVQFDGVDDYLEPDPSGSTGVLDFDYWENFSIAFWVRAPNDQVDFSGTENYILSRFSDSATSRPYNFFIYNSTHANAGKIGFVKGDTVDNTSIVSTIKINDNKWHHITGVRADLGGTSQFLLYVDGSLDNSTNDIVLTQTTNALYISIGKRPNSAYYFTGLLDEIIVYDIELSAASVALLYAGTSTLTNKVGYWNFDDDVSMYGRWAAQPNFKPNSKSWDVNMLFERDP